MSKQSFKISGITIGVYKSPFSMSFHFRMLFFMVYVFLSGLFSVHCFLSCIVRGSYSCSFTSCSSFMGKVMSMSIWTGSSCCMFMLPILHSMTFSVTCVVTGGSSSKGKYPNYFSSSGNSLMSSSISISVESVSAKVFQIPGMYSNVMSWDSSSNAQLFPLEFRVFFSRNFFSGR